MDLLTKKQYKTYILIKEYIKEHGYSPSVRELCSLAGVSSTATIHVHLRALKDKGYITCNKGSHRAIRIIKELEEGDSSE